MSEQTASWRGANGARVSQNVENAQGLLDTDSLRQLAEGGEIETVVVAAPDALGRLNGKRYTVGGFLDSVAHKGAQICDYVLARDVENQPFPVNWERGFGDLTLRPDPRTLRVAAWLDRSALVLCDFTEADGTYVDSSPRQVLRRQLERLAERGLEAKVASELEFMLFRTSYDEARAANYRRLPPGARYNSDFMTYAPSMAEDVMGPMRRLLRDSGFAVEYSKGESNLGQMEVNFRYSDPLAMADDHVIYKEAAKLIADSKGYALTFMPKYDEREGNSCHIHMSLWRGDRPAFADDAYGRTQMFDGFLAGQLEYSREMAFLFAPNVNSYKRFAAGSFAPTNLVWGEDNRTCGLRVVGEGPSLRVESRVGGGDCNPYFAFAAMIAMGLRGIDEQLQLEPPVTGDGYAAVGARRLPTSLGESIDLLEQSELARESFGAGVVSWLVEGGRNEQRAFEAAVTDWELHRTFERL